VIVLVYMLHMFGGSAPREEISHQSSCIHEASFSINFVLYSNDLPKFHRDFVESTIKLITIMR
jgi:hypothetical protein